MESTTLKTGAYETINLLEDLARWVGYRISTENTTQDVQSLLIEAENLLKSAQAAYELCHYEAAVNVAVNALSPYDGIMETFRGKAPFQQITNPGDWRTLPTR